ncbi:predicted phosphohydrolases [Clostridium sp. CAG:914]|nr:predicted phosphohydrolases [Clostridium sp. CAG:914]
MKNIEIVKDILSSKKLKKDITFIHIGDIHYNETTSAKKLEYIKYAIEDAHPDYIFITGDLLDRPKITKNKEKIKLLVSWLNSLGNIAKVFISLGNHDIILEEDYKFFNKLNDINNIYVLNNQSYEDENVFISGFTLPTNYYYNIEKHEDEDALLETLQNNFNLVTNLPKKKYKVALIHSPILLSEKKIVEKSKEYDLVLSGHMHNGLIPRILDKIIKNNYGLISPDKRLFAKNTRGKIKTKYYTIIITGGITKLSPSSTKILSKLNGLYPISINKITVKGEK